MIAKNTLKVMSLEQEKLSRNPDMEVIHLSVL